MMMDERLMENDDRAAQYSQQQIHHSACKFYPYHHLSVDLPGLLILEDCILDEKPLLDEVVDFIEDIDM